MKKQIMGAEARMKPVLLCIGGAVMLAACHSKPSVNEKNASIEQVAESLRKASDNGKFMSPGEWVSSVTVDQISMPGLPAEAQSSLKNSGGQVRTMQSCLSQQDAKQPPVQFLAGNDQCRYDHFTMAHGKIDAKMRCSAHGAGETIVMTGTYSPTSYQMTMQSNTDAPTGQGIAMRMHVEAKRIGECAAKGS